MDFDKHMEVFLKARLQRLHFERFAGYSIVMIAITIIPVGMLSDQLAMRVSILAPAIGILATAVGGTLGAAWWRGHADNRLMLVDTLKAAAASTVTPTPISTDTPTDTPTDKGLQ